ncbi:hypothetical protein [Porticoccus sp.]
MRYIVLAVIFITGCADDKYDVGYDDGYAAGYNTTCKIRATMIEGDWGNKSYSRGYAEGQAAGALACKSGSE